MSVLRHEKVKHGLCRVCGHYGEDCTGYVPRIFVNVGAAVMKGSEHVGTMVSKNLAKRVARALNTVPPNKEGC